MPAPNRWVPEAGTHSLKQTKRYIQQGVAPSEVLPRVPVQRVGIDVVNL